MANQLNNGINNGVNNGSEKEHTDQSQTPMPGISPYPPPGVPGFYGFPMLPSTLPKLPNFPTEQDNGMFALFHEMNNRLKAIESNVAKIGPMEKDMTYLKVQVSQIHDSNTALTHKVQEVERACQFNSNVFDDIMRSREEISETISRLQTQNSILYANVQSLEEKHTELNTRYLDLQAKTMEDELIIFGVDEAPTSDKNDAREDVTKTLTNTLTEKLIENDNIVCDLDYGNLNFHRVYRVGNPTRAAETGRPRPIIAKFKDLNDRNVVKRAGILLNNTKQRIKIYEHFPREIEERRKKLYPIVRYLSKQGEKVALVKDRLYINNKLYNVNNGIYTDKSGSTCYVSPLNAPRYAEGSQNDRPSSTTQELSQRPVQTGYRRAGRQPIVNRNLSFTTPNRYASLQMDVDRNIQKRKERSPLENDNQKRQNTDEVTVIPSDLVEKDGLLVNRDSIYVSNPWKDTTVRDPEGAPQSVTNADDADT